MEWLTVKKAQGLQAEISQILVPERDEAGGSFWKTSSNHFKSETKDLNKSIWLQRQGSMPEISGDESSLFIILQDKGSPGDDDKIGVILYGNCGGL